MIGALTAVLGAAKPMLRKVPVSTWIAGAVAAGLVLALGAQTVRLGAAESRIETLDGRVADLTERLTTCQVSRATLEEAVLVQNAAVIDMADEAERRTAAAQEAAEAARQEAAEARDRAERFRSRPIEGATTCERVLDVDAAVLAEIRGQER